MNERTMLDDVMKARSLKPISMANQPRKINRRDIPCHFSLDERMRYHRPTYCAGLCLVAKLDWCGSFESVSREVFGHAKRC
jgi:hypothetical protein